MPLHPAPPQELPDLVEGYRQAMRSLIDVGRSCPADKLDDPTPCPGWSVRDHLAHIAGLEAYLDGGDYPEVELPERGHLHHEFAVWMEHGVQVRRGRPVEEVLDELETLLHNRIATLSNPELTLETVVDGPMGLQMPLSELLARRLTDIWVHEQDIREAIDRFGNLDSPAASMFVHRIVQAFPVVVPHRVDLPAGQSVILESTGPVTARVGVRMAHGEHGEVVAHPLFTGDADTAAGDHADQIEHPHEEVATTSIQLSTDALTRRAAGRRSTLDTAYRIVGDEEVARAVLDALVITP
jgi:uncharacterized protein (TIGR03083 family)